MSSPLPSATNFVAIDCGRDGERQGRPRAAPPGHDVDVEVIRQARTAGGAQVYADVEALGPERVPQPADAPRDGAGDLDLLVGRQLLVVDDLPEGDDHQVPVIVRITIHQDEHRAAAPHDEVLFVAVFGGEA